VLLRVRACYMASVVLRHACTNAAVAAVILAVAALDAAVVQRESQVLKCLVLAATRRPT
jgi:hypothetical protein